MQLDDTQITLNELGNDGKTVYLYYDGMAGMYLAFGLSAYYTTMVVEPYLSYSEALQMPVALLRRDHILYLRQSLRKIEHVQKSFYRFEMKTPIGEAGYDKWARPIRTKFHHV